MADLFDFARRELVLGDHSPQGLRLPMRELGAKVAALANEGVFLGTSSWKYPGWLGQLYDEARYLTRGKFSNAKFEANCLSEYAEVFSTVCLDACYYTFPSEKWLERLAKQVPAGFKFGFKITGEITLAHFPNLRRFGKRAGSRNAHFLNAELFAREFITPCEAIREKVGVIIFEFSHFHESDYQRGRDFLPHLDTFLSRVPKGWQYSVEIRNRSFLHPEYFDVLRSHGVAHCYNSWEKMPSVADQMAMKESRTADFVAGRFLLSPGRKYAEAVEMFQPYRSLQEPDYELREAARVLIEQVRSRKTFPSFLFVNNRLEGNALQTIGEILGIL